MMQLCRGRQQGWLLIASLNTNTEVQPARVKTLQKLIKSHGVRNTDPNYFREFNILLTILGH
jgi:hypothetical protein